MKNLVEELLYETVQKVCGSPPVTYQGKEIDWTPSFRTITYYDALKEVLGVDVQALSEAELKSLIQSRGLSLPEPPHDRADLIDMLFGKVVEPTLIQPTFVMDYPVEISPLARRHRKDPTVTERFELIVAGKEIANAYSELNDPIDQRERLLRQAALREAGGLEAMPMDEDFLRALEYGMPPTAGLGLGIDRLTMLLTDAPSIQEVILFPLLRPENKPTPHTT
jgi:lysyl-tRNA synthetase class 2